MSDETGFLERVKGAAAYTVETPSEDGTLGLARKLGALLRPGDWLALIGELGSGKTVFAKGIAEALKCGDPVASPTFVIMQTYKPKARGALCLNHVDLYRVALREVGSLPWEETLSGNCVTVVEWAEKAAGFWPAGCLPVRISHLGDLRRSLAFYSVGDRAAEIIRKLKEKK